MKAPKAPNTPNATKALVAAARRLGGNRSAIIEIAAGNRTASAIATPTRRAATASKSGAKAVALVAAVQHNTPIRISRVRLALSTSHPIGRRSEEQTSELQSLM